MPYLVDTDVLVDYLRNVPDAADYLESLGAWSYSVVTAMELMTGAANQKDIRKLEKLLSDYDEVPLSREIGEKGRDIRNMLAIHSPEHLKTEGRRMTQTDRGRSNRTIWSVVLGVAVILSVSLASGGQRFDPDREAAYAGRRPTGYPQLTNRKTDCHHG